MIALSTNDSNFDEEDDITIDDEEEGWNENDLHLLVNFVVSMTKDDSLDSIYCVEKFSC